MNRPLLFNRQSKWGLIILRLVIATLVLSASACIPTVQRIYHTPAVTGRVIDLVNLEPIEAAIIQHYNSEDNRSLTELLDPANTIKTNAQGEYSLPSNSSIDALLLIPGYIIRHYPVRISSRKNSALIFVSASGLMRSEEHRRAPLLILDPQPQLIARTPEGDYIDYKLLKTYLYLHSTLGMCDLAIGGDALSALNAARKVYWRYHDSKHQLVEQAYANAYDVWQYLHRSCQFSEKHSLERTNAIYAVRDIIEKIELEVTDLSSQ